MPKSGLNNNQAGASVLEFALVLPLLLLLLFGIIEFGIILFDQAMLTNACREGARAGIVSSTPRVAEAEIREITKSYCEIHLITFASPPTPPTVYVNPTDPDGTPLPSTAAASFGDNLRVTANYSYEFLLISALIPALPESIILGAESVMKYE